MKTVGLEVYSEASNHAVIRAAGRQFPGSLVQGDSLSQLFAEATEISERILALGLKDEQLLYLAQEHQEKLLDRLLHYQEVLAAHGIELPYRPQALKSDLVVLVPEPESGEACR